MLYLRILKICFKISIFYNGNMLDFIENFCSYSLNFIVLWCHFHCSHLTGDERGSHCLRVLKLRVIGSVISYYWCNVLFYPFSLFTFCFGSSGDILMPGKSRMEYLWLGSGYGSSTNKTWNNQVKISTLIQWSKKFFQRNERTVVALS